MSVTKPSQHEARPLSLIPTLTTAKRLIRSGTDRRMVPDRFGQFTVDWELATDRGPGHERPPGRPAHGDR